MALAERKLHLVYTSEIDPVHKTPSQLIAEINSLNDRLATPLSGLTDEERTRIKWQTRLAEVSYERKTGKCYQITILHGVLIQGGLLERISDGIEAVTGS